MTTISITQPTYLPWIGYFDIAAQSDITILLDTVQFPRRSWVQRNRIKAANGLMWLTVPVKSKGQYDQKIADTEISDPSFAEKHLRAIEVNYARAPCFAEYFSALSEILSAEASLGLAGLNIALIEWIAGCLKTGISAVRASELPGVSGKRGVLLANICRERGAATYLTTPGAVPYLREDLPAFRDAGIDVLVHDYRHPEYDQLFPPFASHASAVDLILNAGDRSQDVVLAGRRPPVPIEDWVE